MRLPWAVRERAVGPCAALIATLLMLGACAPTPAPATAPKPAAGAAVSATPAPAAAPAPAPVPAVPERATVKAAVLGIVSNAGLYIADAAGYFAEERLDVEFINFRSGVEQIPSLATGQLDVGSGATGAALFNAINQGVPLRIVADHGSIRQGWAGVTLMMRKDLIDTGRVRDYPDLKGLRFALSGISGSGSQINLDMALRKGGSRLTEADVVELGFPEMLPAFSNGAIDGAIIVEPFVTLAEERGLGVAWHRVPDFQPVQQTGVLMYGPSIMQAPDEVAVRFMKAYLRAARDYTMAFERTDPAVRERTIAILMERTTLKDRALYDRIGFAWIDPNGRVVTDSIAEDVGWYVDHGYVRERLDVARIVDGSFAERAVAQLGRFQPQSPP